MGGCPVKEQGCTWKRLHEEVIRLWFFRVLVGGLVLGILAQVVHNSTLLSFACYVREREREGKEQIWAAFMGLFSGPIEDLAKIVRNCDSPNAPHCGIFWILTDVGRW